MCYNIDIRVQIAADRLVGSVVARIHGTATDGTTQPFNTTCRMCFQSYSSLHHTWTIASLCKTFVMIHSWSKIIILLCLIIVFKSLIFTFSMLLITKY